jgi:hypothetical protein
MTKFALSLSLLAAALILCAPASTSPPPRTAQALPAKVAHAQNRARYLIRLCVPLDFWHVICPLPYSP